MKAAYLDTIGLIERLHRHFLEIVKLELDGMGVHDINNVLTSLHLSLHFALDGTGRLASGDECPEDV